MNSVRNPTTFIVSLAGGIVVALGVGFLVGHYAWPPRGAGADRTVSRGGVDRTAKDLQAVVARGRLDPVGGVINVGVPMGDRLNRVVVKQGQEVKKGEELAYLESHSDRLADCDLAKIQITEAELNQEQVEKVEPLDIQAQKARVRLIDDQLATAKADLARLQSLKLSSVPQQQMEMQALAVRKAEEELVAAQAVRDKIQAGHAINLRLAAAKVTAAKATLQAADARLKHTIIRAPTDGKVLKIVARAGETLGAQPILQMGDTQHMTAIAEVYETDVQFLREGDRATITSPALPGTVTGKVVSIGNMVAKNRQFDLDPTAAADQRIVDVKVLLDDSTTAANFINLQVTVSIAPSNRP